MSLLQIHKLTATFEDEKFELQKSHTKAIQELLEDTNSRLHKMESEYQQQIESTVSGSTWQGAARVIL